MWQRTWAFVWEHSPTWHGTSSLTTLGWTILGISWHLWCSWTSWSWFISTVCCEQISSQSTASQTASANLPRNKIPQGNIQNTEPPNFILEPSLQVSVQIAVIQYWSDKSHKLHMWILKVVTPTLFMYNAYVVFFSILILNSGYCLEFSPCPYGLAPSFLLSYNIGNIMQKMHILHKCHIFSHAIRWNVIFQG